MEIYDPPNLNKSTTFLDTSQNQSLSISLISNSRLLRDGLTLLLREYLDFHLAGTYTSDFTKASNLEATAPQVVLLDTHIGQSETLQWIHYWSNRYPPACVLLLEMCENIDTLLSYIEAGASGFTFCGASTFQVSEMIQLALQGSAKCSPQIIAHLFERLATLKQNYVPIHDFDVLLTARELEVMAYVVKGYSNQQVAEALVVTTRTIKYHMHNILEKLACKNRYEAAKVVIRQGWVKD